MATLKVYDGTQWQVVAGQGSPGQGIPSGGSTGTLLTKNSAASLDTSWTNPSLVVENAGGGQSRLAVNAPPFSTGAAMRVQPTVATAPALDVWPAWGQAQAQQSQILRVVDQGGGVGWFVDRYGKPKQFIQAGNTVGTSDVNGLLYITFPEVFLSIPHVVCNETSDIRAFCYSINANQSTSGFLARVVFYHGGYVNGNVRINWMAFETRS